MRADAISLINSIPAMAIDVETRRPRLGIITGGLSGPAIRPIAVKLVWEAARRSGFRGGGHGRHFER
jgi:dihydroorotate dehydrogenase (NAD+) catalytic subunit